MRSRRRRPRNLLAGGRERERRALRANAPPTLSALSPALARLPHPITGGWPSASESEHANGDARGGGRLPAANAGGQKTIANGKRERRAEVYVPHAVNRRQDAVRRETVVARCEEDGPAAGLRPLAHRAGTSADGARAGEPAVAVSLRPGPRQEPRQLRQEWHAANTPRIARLAGPRVRPPRVEQQGNAPSPDDQRRLPAEFRCHAGARESRSGKRPRFTHAADALGGRVAPGNTLTCSCHPASFPPRALPCP